MFRKGSENCIFCKIVAKTAPADICFENDEILIFKDVKPVSKHHYLSIPKEHIENVNSLTTARHKELFERLVEAGKRVLQEQGGDLDDSVLGFHLPPFNTVGHLHLHIISPISTFSLLHRTMYKPGTWWFANVKQIQEKLENLTQQGSDLSNKL